MCLYNLLYYAKFLTYNIMSIIKQKLLNAVSAHPKLVTFAIGLALIMAVGTAIGILDQQHLAFAASSSTGSGGSGTPGASGAAGTVNGGDHTNNGNHFGQLANGGAATGSKPGAGGKGDNPGG
jgi:hypothetical protein